MAKTSKKAGAVGNAKDVYGMESILGYKREYNSDYFYVKWIGYPEEEASWEPRKNIMQPDAEVRRRMAELKNRWLVANSQCGNSVTSSSPASSCVVSSSDVKNVDVLSVSSLGDYDPSLAPVAGAGLPCLSPYVVQVSTKSATAGTGTTSRLAQRPSPSCTKLTASPHDSSSCQVSYRRLHKSSHLPRKCVQTMQPSDQKNMKKHERDGLGSNMDNSFYHKIDQKRETVHHRRGASKPPTKKRFVDESSLLDGTSETLTRTSSSARVENPIIGHGSIRGAKVRHVRQTTDGLQAQVLIPREHPNKESCAFETRWMDIGLARRNFGQELLDYLLNRLRFRQSLGG